MTNEQEKQWRELFGNLHPFQNHDIANNGFYVSAETNKRWDSFKVAKQSSQAIIDAKDRELEAEREKVKRLREILIYAKDIAENIHHYSITEIDKAIASTAPAKSDNP